MYDKHYLWRCPMNEWEMIDQARCGLAFTRVYSAGGPLGDQAHKLWCRLLQGIRDLDLLDAVLVTAYGHGMTRAVLIATGVEGLDNTLDKFEARINDS